jgi:hypothetical protein
LADQWNHRSTDAYGNAYAYGLAYAYPDTDPVRGKMFTDAEAASESAASVGTLPESCARDGLRRNLCRPTFFIGPQPLAAD